VVVPLVSCWGGLVVDASTLPGCWVVVGTLLDDVDEPHPTAPASTTAMMRTEVSR
jgi:hypothetical protein